MLLLSNHSKFCIRCLCTPYNDGFIQTPCCQHKSYLQDQNRNRTRHHFIFHECRICIHHLSLPNYIRKKVSIHSYRFKVRNPKKLGIRCSFQWHYNLHNYLFSYSTFVMKRSKSIRLHNACIKTHHLPYSDHNL